jgi:hypothetical protein
MQSMKGDTIQLPKLIEYDSIPRDKREIPTPELVRKFPHLQEIAREIPPLDPKAQIHLLIGCDAPEILKVRAFKNGPKGAPLLNDVMPCSNHFVVKESPAPRDNHDAVFLTQSNDNEKAMSIEDRRFLKIMQRSIRKNEQGNWETSLPQRAVKPIFPRQPSASCRTTQQIDTKFQEEP